MSYQIILKPSAEKEMNRLPNAIYGRVDERILSLRENPRPRGIKKLSGREEYRVRVGDYRILFTIDDVRQVVFVSAVRHRREVYG